MPEDSEIRITLIGAGTIGLSFAVFHLSHLSSPEQLTIYDTRPDLQEHVQDTLTGFYDEQKVLPDFSKIKLASSLQQAVQSANIVQESGPENLSFKQNLWAEVERHVASDALLWSSTSGIPASEQVGKMQDKSRVLVVHPYNPPHIMPLLELVPSPSTSTEVIEKTQNFWTARGRVPIHIQKEVTGFVANRLAFALLREAIHLVNEGVVSVEEIDKVVESSMGPRWAVAGPFKSYHAGGGDGGLEAFFKNIGQTVQDCWSNAGTTAFGTGWEEKISKDTANAYGIIDTAQRDRITRLVLGALQKAKDSGEK